MGYLLGLFQGAYGEKRDDKVYIEEIIIINKSSYGVVWQIIRDFRGEESAGHTTV